VTLKFALYLGVHGGTGGSRKSVIPCVSGGDLGGFGAGLILRSLAAKGGAGRFLALAFLLLASQA
jgi:hypothetical protein